MDKLPTVLVTEELWRADPGIGSAVGSAGFGTDMMLEFGDEWMKEEWLPDPLALKMSLPTKAPTLWTDRKQ